MDIRKFFPAKNGGSSRPAQIANKKDDPPAKTSKETTKKRRKAQVIDSDSEDDLLPPAKKPSAADKRSSRKRLLDSDEDIIASSPEPSKKLRQEEPRKKSPLKVVNGTKKMAKPGRNLTPITALDFFSSKPVSRSDKVSNKELATHDDPDFKLTLQQSQTMEVPSSPASSKDKKKKEEKKAIPDKPSRKEEDKVPKKEDKTKLAKKSAKKEDESLEKKVEKSKPETKKQQEVSTVAQTKPEKKPEESKKEATKPATPPRTKAPPPAKITPPPKESGEQTTPKSDKRANFLAYKKFLERDGPKALGSRTIPEPVAGCLTKTVFVLSGVLDCIERDEAKTLIEQCGGKVTQSISKNTSYLVAGRDVGASKMDKAQKLGTTILDEDQFFQLLEAKTGSKHQQDTKESAKKSSTKKEEPKPSPPKKSTEVKTWERLPVPKVEPPAQKKKLPASTTKQKAELWVDKYKPQSSKQIIGQQGAKSNVVKLTAWLANWDKNRANKPARLGDDGAVFRAALLSGPPGIGKTTTAQLVCKELGYDTVEFNASDTRSKKSLQQEIMELLSSQSLAAFAGGSLPQAVSKKHAVIMDEVDGMAGNEDRGGMQELIALIKATQVPILCICNNRSHPKVLSLSRYCFDLRFSRPRTEQIRGAMMSVAYKEGMKVAPQALADLIESSNHDVRQVLHSLSLMAASQSAVSSESVKADIGRGLKDLKLGPFDVLRKVFASGKEKEAMSLADKSGLFFHDYSIGPLFVQENYLQVIPHEAKGDKLAHLRLLSEVADSLTDGDLVERQIRSQNSWSLLPVQAVYSSVVPGELLRGHLGGQISFPTWLGRNSAHGKNRRLAQQLQLHTRLRTSASCVDLAMDYLPRGLRDQLLGPTLAEGDVTPTLELMQHYYLQRDDLDAISLLTQWPGRGADPLQQLPPKVKAALTRAFNKEGFLVPYATMSLRKTKARQTTEEEGEEEEVDSEEDDLANDAMIKVSKSSSKKQEDPDFQPSTSKGNKSTRGRKPK